MSDGTNVSKTGGLAPPPGALKGGGRGVHASALHGCESPKAALMPMPQCRRARAATHNTCDKQALHQSSPSVCGLLRYVSKKKTVPRAVHDTHWAPFGGWQGHKAVLQVGQDSSRA